MSAEKQPFQRGCPARGGNRGCAILMLGAGHAFGPAKKYPQFPTEPLGDFMNFILTILGMLFRMLLIAILGR